MTEFFFSTQHRGDVTVLQLLSADGTNRLTVERVEALLESVEKMTRGARPLIITGNDRFFSAGAELAEIAELTGPTAYSFSKMGQELMSAIDRYPAPVYAAISGYCMGGGLDLALACDFRIAHPHAMFGHRGAALGLITGWGGTQRLPRLVGRAKALEMFVAAEKLTASNALELGLVDQIAVDPIEFAIQQVTTSK